MLAAIGREGAQLSLDMAYALQIVIWCQFITSRKDVLNAKSASLDDGWTSRPLMVWALISDPLEIQIRREARQAAE